MEKEINIELTTRKLILKINNTVFTSYPVAIGKPSTPTPTGNFKIINKIKHPGGVLGSRWMQFTMREHGIHGTNQPNLIGKAVSLGCVRMYNQDVEAVYERVKINTPVKIKSLFQDSDSRHKEKPLTSSTVYIVKSGDSLWKISHKFNTSVKKIKDINNLKSDNIFPGQRLIVPL